MQFVIARAIRTQPVRRPGFTLVELLIVITIIGILVSLLMPAVNSAREAGRRAQCSNNVSQMAKACLMHESKYQFLPSGGWGWRWAGDPSRGFGSDQPGGWHYNILPFIDLQDLHDMGARTDGKRTDANNPPTAAQMFAGMQRGQTPVPLFICPTRRKVQTYPRTSAVANYYNISDPIPRQIARSDYAANGGSVVGAPAGVDQNPNYLPNYDFGDGAALDGVIYRASALPMAKITDGPSYTYLIGERYLCVDNYYTINIDNDQGWDAGYDYDVTRWTDPSQPPMQDRSGVGGFMTRFGSAHSAGFNMAFCDGSVRKMNFNIDVNVHKMLGSRNDGGPTQLQDVEAGSR